MSERIKIHPGEIIEQEFMAPTGMTIEALASSLGLSVVDVKEILIGSKPLTAELAWGLGHTFNITAEFWSNLQAEHDRAWSNAPSNSPRASSF